MTVHSALSLKRGAWRPPVLIPVGMRMIREHYSRFPREGTGAKFCKQRRCWPKPTPIPPGSTMGPRTNADRPDLLHWESQCLSRSNSMATRTVENEIYSRHGLLEQSRGAIADAASGTSPSFLPRAIKHRWLVLAGQQSHPDICCHTIIISGLERRINDRYVDILETPTPYNQTSGRLTACAQHVRRVINRGPTSLHADLHTGPKSVRRMLVNPAQTVDCGSHPLHCPRSSFLANLRRSRSSGTSPP